MGLQDRDYIRSSPRGHGPVSAGPLGGLPHPRLWSFNAWLIAVNVAVFVLGAALQNAGVPVWRADELRLPQGATGPIVAVDEYPIDGGTTPYLAATRSGRLAPAPPEVYRDAGAVVFRTLVARDAATGDMVPAGRRLYIVQEPLTAFGHFSTAKGFFWIPGDGSVRLGLEVWRLITFQFLHAGIFHLFFNMFGLFIFGRIVEQYLGFKRYAAFYLMCGLCGGLLYLVLNLAGTAGLPLPGALAVAPTTPLVGASAGVFGVIVASAFIAGNTVVQLLFPPIPLKLRTFAYGYVAIAAFNLFVAQGPNQGGDAAHIGGALAGFFFIRRVHLLRDFFDVFGNTSKPGRPDRRRGPRPPTDREMDRILAKISEHGMGSLTSKERRLLERSSANRRG